MVSDDPCVSSPVLLQIGDDLGNEKFCVDANQSGAGNWLKYIRGACSCDEQNLAVCHVNDQVRYLLAYCHHFPAPTDAGVGRPGERL